MATSPNAATQQDIQNSEKLLDLSNQLNNSINERRKLLKNITAEEQNYFSTVKQQQKLSQDIAANAEKYLGYQIKSKDLAKQIKATDDNINKSRLSYRAIELKLEENKRKAILEARKLTDKDKNLAKQRIDLEEHSNELQIAKQQALRVGNAGLAAQIQQEINANNRNANALDKRAQNTKKAIQLQVDIINNAKKITKDAQDSAKAQEEELAFLKRNLEVRKQIEKSTGLLGGMAKAASKIPGIGQYLNADEAIDEMEKLAASIEESGGKATSFGNRMKIAGKGLQVLAKGAYENLKSPEAVFTFFLKAALTANDQAVKLGKSLGYGAERADAFRENLVGIESASNNLNVTTKNLVEAFSELATATGFAYEFTADQLETQIKLTKQVGLTADEAAQVQRFAVLNNKTSEETYKSFLKGITATRNQLKVGIDFKATLAEAVKVSGQLAANLGNNPEIIGRAIVTAKAFGMTLEQVAKSGESLLNFESSIENELKAELLTGKELNLERARAAALAGDQITLAEELNKQIGTASEFTKMNVLQQRALAESVGMTTDELANTLRKREEALASGKSLAQITEEEAAQALERQSVQDKFNVAIEKLQSIIGNLVAGPLGSFLDLLSGALNIINYMATPLKIVAGIFAGIFGISKAIAITEGLSAAIAGRKVGFAAAELSYKTASNVISIKDNALAAISLATEGSKLSFKQLGLALEGESFAVKTAAYGLALKDLAVENAKKGVLIAQNLIEKAGLAIQQSALLLTIREAWKSIAGAAMSAFESAAKIPFVGWALGGIAAAGAIALGASLMTKGDDVMSEGGYGKRTLLAPEGAIRLNDNDTVIAGTNLMDSKPKGLSPQTNSSINVSPEIQMPQIDLTPMIAAINEVTAAVNKLYSKDTAINMDGKKVGTTLVQGSYKVA
jgi:hypothetical protein